MYCSIAIHGYSPQEKEIWKIPSFATHAVASLLNDVPRVWTTIEPFQKETESVWTHTTETIALTKKYDYIIEKYWWDIAHIINLLLVHDIPEILTGDMDPRKIKSNKKNPLENWAMTNLISNPNDRDLWYEYSSWETLDAQFAKAFDKMQFLLKLQTIWWESEYPWALENYRKYFLPFTELLQIVDNPIFLNSDRYFQKAA